MYDLSAVFQPHPYCLMSDISTTILSMTMNVYSVYQTFGMKSSAQLSILIFKTTKKNEKEDHAPLNKNYLKSVVSIKLIVWICI